MQFAARFKHDNSTVFKQEGIAARFMNSVGAGPTVEEDDRPIFGGGVSTAGSAAALLLEGLCLGATGDGFALDDGVTLELLEVDFATLEEEIDDTTDFEGLGAT